MKLDPEKEQLMRKITGNKIAKSKQSHLKTPSPSLFPRATVHLSLTSGDPLCAGNI